MSPSCAELIALGRNECDTAGTGSLNREAFIKGMWRIDEELRKAQLRAQTLPFRPRKRSVPLLS